MNHPIRLAKKTEATALHSINDAHHDCFFCDPSLRARHELDAISLSNFYPRGVRLFAEGEPPRGVYLLRSGRAKLLVGSSNGKTLMRVAEQGELLGLSATLSGHLYEGSAEMFEAGQVNFIRRDHFLRLLETQARASLHAAQHLSQNYLAVYEQVRTLALSDSAAEKLARLLLGWCTKHGQPTAGGIYLKLPLKHAEIAQASGVTRETVTRLLGELRSKGIIQLKGADLLIKNKAVLEGMINP